MSDPPAASPLTDRQSRFVEEYLIDLNATQAAIRAGYSEDTARQQGSRLLTNVDVEAALAEAHAARAKRAEVSQDWVVSRLIENVERAMQAVEIKSQGAGTGEYKYDGAVANRALELLGKHVGMFTDKGEVKISADDTIAGLLGRIATNGRRIHDKG